MPTSFSVERRATYSEYRTRELVVAGDGPTIVLVHGFAHAAETWIPLLDLLHRAGRAAVAVDLPGFGKADPLLPGSLVPQLDRFLGEVIRRYAGSNGVVLVGNSLGAAMALRAGRAVDLPVNAVVALDTAGITWRRLVSIGLDPIVSANQLYAAIGCPERVHRSLATRAAQSLLYGRKSAVVPEVVAQLAAVASDPAETHRLLRLGARFKAELDRTTDHGDVRVPLVAVHGARDRLVPVSASRILYDANPGSRLVVLPHAGHCPQLDATSAVSQLVREMAGISNTSREIS
ncbi:alpha/beta fold hydrolase [Nocardia sp. XZ_19_385]|uniref:alpha/beta fold hydrolase n=1 Tax=Nocardia sp. XZ_19_385 TaxID=2769488 RepID=UPI00188EDC56|nr:alpha/beta fold hydrolase [Nocardia sp. XZ_19_385]